MNTENLFVDWFCFDCYTHSACTKMETEIYDYAKKILLYRLVADEDLKEVIRQLQLKQDFLANQNPRWKRIKIQFSGEMNGLIWLNIACSQLCLRKVLGNF